MDEDSSSEDERVKTKKAKEPLFQPLKILIGEGQDERPAGVDNRGGLSKYLTHYLTKFKYFLGLVSSSFYPLLFGPSQMAPSS